MNGTGCIASEVEKEGRKEMAETGGAGGDRVCNESCGCPVPCPGGVSCRCVTVETAGGEVHRRCSCGEHCGCNPCTCASAVVGVGKDNCKCDENCQCATCAK